jgi:Plasmid stabilization system protein
MRTRIYAESAETDIDGIIEEIVKNNPHAAKKWVALLEEKCQRIARFPNMGKRRDDLRQDVYCFPYGDYLIFYDIEETAVVIVHVIHGARNLPEVFHDEGQE